MPAKKFDISASDFREPLIKVLGQLSNFKVGQSILHERTYDPVFQMMGIDRNQYGMDGATNVHLAERWVQWCVTTLVAEGLISREGKGRWTLTQKGIQEAQNLISASEQKKENVMTTDNLQKIDKPETSVQETPAIADENSGKSILVGPNSAEELYHPDAYIRSLALVGSTCLGAPSDKSSTCKDCRVKGNCLNAMSAIFSQLAAKLAQEDKDEELKKKLAEEALKNPAPAPKVPEPVAPTPTSGLVLTPDAKVSFCAAAMEAPCQCCGKDIEVGTPSAWVRKLGMDKKSSAMLHRDCYNKLAGAQG